MPFGRTDSIARQFRHRANRATVQIQPLEARRLFSAGLDGFGTVAADGNDLVADALGRVHRIWRDADTGLLKYAVRNAQQVWGPVSTVDNKRVGGEMSIEIDPQGRPAVAYYDYVNRDLMYAVLDGGNWLRSRLDSAGDTGDFPSLKFDPNGRAFISYYDRTNGDLKLAWQSSSGSWSTRALETAGNTGAYSSLTFSPAGLPRIAYSDVDGLRLKFAWQNANGTWEIRSIDKTVTAGVRFTSIAMDQANNLPYIAYYDVRKKDLRMAWSEGGAWHSQRVAQVGWQGEFSNLYVDSAGRPNVVYFNRSLGTTNLATLVSGEWKHSLLAIGGQHISITLGPTGKLLMNHVDPLTGLLRTTTTNFDYQPTNDPAQRIIHWETIGGSGGPVSKRTVGWPLDQPGVGWAGYVSGRGQQLKNLGMRRLFLHNPFGTLPWEPFQFDQYIHAQQAGLTWLTNGFTEAFKPFVESGVEVICYIGRLQGDFDFDTLTNFDDYMDRVMRSIRPMIDAGCSIGFDSIVGATEDSRAYMVVKALRDSGIKVYAENRPPADYPWWHDHNGVYYDDGWIDSNPAVNPTLHWAAPNSMLRGEIIRYTAHQPSGYGFWDLGWRGPNVVAILRDGHTAATDIDYLNREGLTLQGLMNQALAQSRPGVNGVPFSERKVEEQVPEDPIVT